MKNFPLPDSHTHPDSIIGMIDYFVGYVGQSVEAHARQQLTEEEESALTAFARDELDEAARKALIPLLAHNTSALEYFAALLRGNDTQFMCIGDACAVKTSNQEHKSQ